MDLYSWHSINLRKVESSIDYFDVDLRGVSRIKCLIQEYKLGMRYCVQNYRTDLVYDVLVFVYLYKCLIQKCNKLGMRNCIQKYRTDLVDDALVFGGVVEVADGTILFKVDILFSYTDSLFLASVHHYYNMYLLP